MARAALHFWEEPCLAGSGGAGAVFFTGCGLRCRYCQNFEISENAAAGREVSAEELRQMLRALIAQGARAIDLVTPGHYTRQLIPVLRSEKWPVPVIWNSSGYELPETLRELDGLIDIYLPDFKYADPELARELSGAPDYTETALAAIREMVRQTGPCVFDPEGRLLRGTMVRHLILPGHTRNSLQSLQLLRETFGGSVRLSLLAQYTPCRPVPGHPELDRRITRRELEKVAAAVYELGFDGYIQELSASGERYIPDFSGKDEAFPPAAESRQPYPPSCHQGKRGKEMVKDKIEAFFRETGMHPDCNSVEDGIARFRAAMEKGLKGEPSPFAMYPTYVSASGELPSGKKVIVMDAGGTNLRLALVHFRGGRPVIDAQVRYPMPGTKCPLTKQEYLTQMVDYLRPYLASSDRIGYCFSYPAEILPNRDGRLTAFNKEVHVSGSEGMEVCRDLKAALRAADLPGDQKCVLLNDTVAALLGGIVDHSAGEDEGGIGFILGTGTNTCYIERTDRILSHDMSGQAASMIINMEAGAFDGFAQGEYDRILDGLSSTPGEHLYEKMVSGVYQGLLVTLITRALTTRGFFSENFTERLSHTPSFDMGEIDRFARCPDGDNTLAALCETQEDRVTLLTVIDLISERAAKLVFINLAAVVLHTGTGRSPETPAFICAEGSGIWSSFLFYPKLEKYIRRVLEGELDRYVRITRAKDANLVGSAAAALLNN